MRRWWHGLFGCPQVKRVFPIEFFWMDPEITCRCGRVWHRLYRYDNPLLDPYQDEPIPLQGGE